MTAVLRLSRLSYAYPQSRARALDGIELSLESGLVLLTGPSGGGKSTLLRVCNGLVPHFHGGVIGGRAQVMGRDVATTPTRDLARDVGFVFQDPERQAVYATVERDVAFGLENLGIPRAEMVCRLDEALATCGISHLRTRAISSLSGGERQRLALAGVLAMRPRFLVLDEPLSQLDPEGAGALLAALGTAVRAGTAALIAEHRVEGLVTAGRILRIDQGRLNEVEHTGTVIAAVPLGERRTFHRPTAVPAEARWELRGVTAGNAGVPVVHDLNLAGGEGEVIVLTGPNGSGKTTLLRTIAGLTPTLAGAVRRTPGRVGYLPQNPAVLLHRATVRDEVAWTLRRSGSQESPERILGALGLSSVADRYPGDLSSGERQRAALACVIVGSPAIVLLDEPTRGMDDASRDALTAAVTGIAEAGGSVVLATHDRALAGALATRVLDLRDGTAHELPATAASVAAC